MSLALATLLRAGEAPPSISSDKIYPQLDRSLAERQPLVVAATSDNFPYGYLDSHGRWQGFAVDLLDAIARVSNLRIQRVVGPGHVIYDRFRAGEFDLLQAYSETSDRHAFADFSVPILTLQGAVFVRKHGSPIHRIEDLNGRTFAMIGRSSIGEKFLADRHLTARVMQVDSSEEALSLVNDGDCDATFVSQLTALAVMKQHDFDNVTVLGAPLADYDIRHCFAVHKGDAQLLARLNEGLAILRSTGEFDEIYRRWFGRVGMPLFTRIELISYVALALALGLGATLWGLVRQRVLRRRIARQAEELAESQALLRALYENIPVAIYVFESRDGADWLLSANPRAASFIGVAPERASGLRLEDMARDKPWARELAGLLPRRPPVGGFVQEERTTTDHRRFMFTLVSLAVGAGALPRLCVLMDEVTQQRALDEEVAQMRKLRALGELVGGIAHEFNNLLTPILVNTSLIREEWKHDAPLQQQIAMIAQVAQRAADLTQRLLAFGRKGDRAPEPVALEAIVETCFALLEHTVDRRVVWENAVPRGLPPLYLNRTDLNQILINLLINARDTLLEKLDHPPHGWTPHIRVAAVPLPPETALLRSSAGLGRDAASRLLGWQQLVVEDNGMGMATDVQERIFEPFYTTKEVGKGTGLGLATVWHLVSSIGGRIDVTSKRGEGSAFRVLLPVFPVPSLTAPVPSPNLRESVTCPPARILVAEDDPAVARAVCSALRAARHKVAHAESGRVAWDLLAPAPSAFDLLLVDVNMPGIGGLELVRRAREAKYLGKIVMMTGRLMTADIQEIERCGADNFVAKPFTAYQLLQHVAATLNGTAPKPAI